MAFLFTNDSAKVVFNTTTESTIIPTGGGTLVVPASNIQTGNIIRVTARGDWTTDAIVAPTLRIRVKLTGGSTVTVLDTGAQTCVLTATARSWALDAMLVCLTPGASASFTARGEVRFNSTVTVGTTWDLGGTGGSTIDSTVNQTLNVTAQWGTADVDNAIQCDVFAVEVSGA